MSTQLNQGWGTTEVEAFPQRQGGRAPKLDGLIKVLMDNPGHIYRVYEGMPKQVTSRASSLRAAIKRFAPEKYDRFTVRSTSKLANGGGAVFAAYDWEEGL